jgi:hypothetical protein
MDKNKLPDVGDLVKAHISWILNGSLVNRVVIFKVSWRTSARDLQNDIIRLREYHPEDARDHTMPMEGNTYKPGVSLQVHLRDWPVYSHDPHKKLDEGMIDIAVFEIARKKL